MSDILSEFFEDTQAHLEQIEEHLLKLESDPAQIDLINEVFRSVHSIKGNAGLLGVLEILSIGEEYENFLESVRERGSATPEEVNEMIESLDKLKVVVQKERGETTPDPEEPVSEIETSVASVEDENSKFSQQPASLAETGSNVKEHVVPEEKKITFLTFTLAGEKYGLDIVKVREIILREPITPVPNTKPFVEGLMNLRDQVIPVFDLKSRLDISGCESDAEERNIIVVEIAKVTTGIKVDDVTGIVALPMSRVSPPKEFYGSVPTNYILGIGRTPDGPMILLDADTLCDPEELLY